MRPMRLIGPMRLMGLIGLMGLVGCSGEQQVAAPVEETLSPIAFSASQQEEQVTRAGSGTPLETYTKSFKVWGYKNMSYNDGTGAYGDLQTVMEEYIVDWVNNTAGTTTTNSDGWEYLLLTHPDQSIKYWDFNAKAYRFFGSAEMSAVPGIWKDNSTASPKNYEYTCKADATNAGDAPFYTRLWFSNNSTKPYGQPVVLEFVKPLAEVRFKFTYSDPNMIPLPMLEDPDFRPLNPEKLIAMYGTVTITFPIEGTETQESWTSSPDYSSKYLISFTKPSTSSAENWYTVLPIIGPDKGEEKGQGAYKLTVTVNGADKDCIVPAEYMTWQPGYSYTYIFKVNDEGGVELDNVAIGVKNWAIEKESEYLIYNW